MKTPDLKLPEGIETCFLASADAVAAELARDVADRLRQRLSVAPGVSLVVSGGSTPLLFFQALRGESLDWARVSVVLADERWVAEDDPASNTLLVKKHLLQEAAAGARFIPLKVTGNDAAQARPAIESALAELNLPLDVLVLGMGNDGHTASLFPDAPELQEAMNVHADQRFAVMTPPSQTHQRITLSLPVLAGAGFTALHLKGQDKLETLSRVVADLQNWPAMPVRAFFKPGLKVYWSP
ncbi:6-phosphogluconolactonase [Marinobacter halophilus]|uniref:6-phosphogluconolactonase n=1 Tax=Marinobacter halophilus TaxID=1323740 RepID=A0A2T1K8Z9_9GAMM|nr:6-phosphogluconolactonase [Marinobacter halophilus]PSF06631.1 6-phosphogluconolactonase [Marinobacter halophilus]GGC74259.1 6-phosphogluconolactonase [Marinobacter halophilus]